MIETDLLFQDVAPRELTEETVRAALVSSLPVGGEELLSLSLRKAAALVEDGRISTRATVAFSLSPERERGLLKMRKRVREAKDFSLAVPPFRGEFRPLVVGAGPAGLFSALILAQAGARPLVVERGLPVDERKKSVEAFRLSRVLDPESNIQFGEGGAGAFSDGKLKVGALDPVKFKVLSAFVEAGAPEEILYLVGAHLGTDKLPGLVKAIRERIVSLGGEFRFSTRLSGLLPLSEKVVRAALETPVGREEFDTDTVVLATGHSAEDVFSLLSSLGVPMEARPFGIGVRVEHRREAIDRLVYRDPSLASRLGAASYHLVTHLPGGRSVYSFCMCPGGEVVAAASHPGGVVTNGMSPFARDRENSNAALLVSVTPEDFPGVDPLAGVRLQRSIEKSAFLAGGEDGSAPAVRLDDFLASRPAKADFGVAPSYPLGVRPASPEAYLPGDLPAALCEGIRDFDAWMPGFADPSAVLIGAETRSTSPVRVLRGAGFSVPGFSWLYPVGEGAGYAGGIVSSAADGVRAALAILS